MLRSFAMIPAAQLAEKRRAYAAILTNAQLQLLTTLLSLACGSTPSWQYVTCWQTGKQLYQPQPTVFAGHLLTAVPLAQLYQLFAAAMPQHQLEQVINQLGQTELVELDPASQTATPTPLAAALVDSWRSQLPVAQLQPEFSGQDYSRNFLTNLAHSSRRPTPVRLEFAQPPLCLPKTSTTEPEPNPAVNTTGTQQAANMLAALDKTVHLLHTHPVKLNASAEFSATSWNKLLTALAVPESLAARAINLAGATGFVSFGATACVTTTQFQTFCRHGRIELLAKLLTAVKHFPTTTSHGVASWQPAATPSPFWLGQQQTYPSPQNWWLLSHAALAARPLATPPPGPQLRQQAQAWLELLEDLGLLVAVPDQVIPATPLLAACVNPPEPQQLQTFIPTAAGRAFFTASAETAAKLCLGEPIASCLVQSDGTIFVPGPATAQLAALLQQLAQLETGEQTEMWRLNPAKLALLEPTRRQELLTALSQFAAAPVPAAFAANLIG